MKLAVFSKIISTLAAAAVLATGAFAAGAGHKGSIQILNPVQVNGQSLPAGDYTVTWAGDGPNVTVNFAQGRKVLATAPANLVTLDAKSFNDICEIKTSSSGIRELSALRFSGQKVRLEIGGGGDQTRSGDSMK